MIQGEYNKKCELLKSLNKLIEYLNLCHFDQLVVVEQTHMHQFKLLFKVTTDF